MEPEQIQSMIETGLECSLVNVEGDGSHFQALVVSELFDGKGLVAQHQMVYGTLGDYMQEAIHALSLRTLTPAAWEEAKKRPF